MPGTQPATQVAAVLTRTRSARVARHRHLAAVARRLGIVATATAAAAVAVPDGRKAARSEKLRSEYDTYQGQTTASEKLAHDSDLPEAAK